VNDLYLQIGLLQTSLLSCMYRAQVIQIHILILIILQIRRGYAISVRSNYELIVVCMNIMRMVQIQTRFPIMLLRIAVSPIIAISITMMPSKFSRVYFIIHPSLCN